MKRALGIIGTVVILGAGAIFAFAPSQEPTVEIADGVFADSLGEGNWRLSCGGPCTDDLVGLVCPGATKVGEDVIDVGSRWSVGIQCPGDPRAIIKGN